MKKIFYFGLLLTMVFVLMLGTGSFADSTISGMRFLRIGVGARPVALGESFSAVSDDINSIYWNPAGLGQIESPEVSISHNKWLTDITEQSISYAQPVGNLGTIGGSVRYLHMGEIQSWDENDTSINNVVAYDLSALLCWGRKFGSSFYSGANIKVMNEKLADASAIGYAVDLGALYRLKLAGQRTQVGLACQNLGTEGAFIEESDALPINIKFGVASWLLNEKLILGFDANYPLDESEALYTSIGAEYTLGNILALRAGYNMRDSVENGLALGFGVKMPGWLLDFAYMPNEEFDYTYRITLGIRLPH